MEDAVDDGVGEIIVVQHGAPWLGDFVGGEDHVAMCRPLTTWKRTLATSVP